MRLTLLILLLAAAGCDRPVPDELLGAYRLDDGRLVSVRQSPPDTLRLRLFDTGETRRYARGSEETWEPASAGLEPDDLTQSKLRFGNAGFTLTYPDGSTRTASRLPFPTHTGVVGTGDVNLHVRLTLPSGHGPHPAIVIAHGSGDDAATRSYSTPDFFPAHGIASVVYDKRGTGSSSGSYTHDFELLAEDLSAVAAWTAKRSEIDASRIGVTGYSQGGWIGPLAAVKSPHLGYVIVNYGMIDSPRDEARNETRERFRRLGFDEQTLAEVGALADAAVDVEVSGYRDWDRFDTLVRQYRDRRWMEQVDEPLSDFLRWPHWVVRLVAPYVAPPGLRWDYDSLATLDVLAERGIPSVWLIASHDSSAPNGFTLAELERRQAAGQPIEVRVFTPTDHGLLLFEESEDGSRDYGNYHPDRFRTEMTFARALSGLGNERQGRQERAADGIDAVDIQTSDQEN